ncbi:hypothetical protein [Rubrolithibacter danxiaensis]|uniref:hypothetical protein n=1 Tax=Rubrolithibacter danxiaensis TaxID=3390805 RepID=UPI003BF7C1A7
MKNNSSNSSDPEYSKPETAEQQPDELQDVDAVTHWMKRYIWLLEKYNDLLHQEISSRKEGP